MTAVVGILNKQAVAIAADSAVTVTGANGRKIFNRANKVFALSKLHPSGIGCSKTKERNSPPKRILVLQN